MPSIRLLLTVSEDVYNGLILPKKQQKALNKTVVGLMESYVGNEFIRAHVDGDLHNASVDAVADLKETLNTVWATTDGEIAFGSATTRAGIEAMQREAEASAPASDESSDGVGAAAPVADDSRFTALEDKLENMTRLMEQLLAQGIGTSAPVGVSVAPTAPVAVSGAGRGERPVGGRAWPETVVEEERVTPVVVKAEFADRDIEESKPTPKVVKPVVVPIPVVAEEADDDAVLEGSDTDDAEADTGFASAMLGFGSEFNVGGL